MKCIYDDLLCALNGTCYTAYALVIVDDSVVVYDRYSVFRAVLFAGSAGNASKSAGSSYDLFILFCGRTRNEVGCVSRDHLDQVLRANILFGTVAATVTFLTVDDDLTVDKLHGPFLAGLDTGTDAYASALAFAPLETGLTSFLAGCTVCETCLTCSASGTCDKSDELFFSCRSHFGFHNNLPP